MPFCKFFAGFGSTNKSSISLFFSSYLTLSWSSPPSFLLPQYSCSTKLQWVPGHLFLPRNDATDELARRGGLPLPSAITCNLSPLISGWRRIGTVSSKFFDTQIPSVSTEKLVLSRYARCVLFRLRCNGHSFLLSFYLFRIGRIENPSCSACENSSQDTSHLILHCPATDSLRRSLFGDSLVQALGNCSVSGAQWTSANVPIPRKESGNNNNKTLSWWPI